MTRLEDWPLRFDSFITSRLCSPFAWGRNDCALFAADQVLAITGQDVADGLRSHRTATQAARVIRRHGGLEAITSRLLVSCAVNGARQGDVLLVRHMGREMLSVCFDAQCVVAPALQGLAMLSRSAAVRAWRVG